MANNYLVEKNIISKSPVFVGKFENQEQVFDEFDLSHQDSKGIKILFAEYDVDGWEGRAFVLFQKDNKLFEINTVHCSCRGLEDQWEPEECVLEQLYNVATEKRSEGDSQLYNFLSGASE